MVIEEQNVTSFLLSGGYRGFNQGIKIGRFLRVESWGTSKIEQDEPEGLNGDGARL